MANKKIIPQEQQAIIIDLYVNKQYGIEKVSHELKAQGINYGATIVKRVLQENNIHIRNFTEAKVGRYKMEVPQELQNEIIDLYNRGYGLEKIVELLNTSFSFDKVRSILIDNGVHIRTVQESAQVKVMPDLRKYSINDNYNFQSHNGAWIVGLLAADGYLPITAGAKNRVVLTLQRKDEDCLELIKQQLNFTGPIHQYVSTQGYENSTMAFTSYQLRKKIESYGVVNAKTYKIEHLPEKLQQQYWLDYLRGYWDGDGCLYEKRGSLVMGLTSASKDFLNEVKEYLAKRLDLMGGAILPDHNVYCLKYGKQDSAILGSAFYNNDYLALPRKKEKYFALREQLPRA